jgi:asparagine synthetase B (glutamine-hydrolysing)
MVGNVAPDEFNMTPWCGTAESADVKSYAYICGTLQCEGVPGVNCAGAQARNFLNGGISMIDDLRGYFAIVLHSRPHNLTVIAADRRASIPIYYVECGGTLYFASELKGLMTIPGLSRDLDFEAMAVFLAAGHLMARQTLLKSVRRLQGGEALVIRDGCVERVAYWKFRPGLNSGGVADRILEEEAGELIAGAVKRNLGDPERTVIFLSGGADSRGILAAATEAVGGRGDRLSTVTWGAVRGSGSSDTAIAERVTKEFGVNHHFVKRSLDCFESDFPAVNYILDGQSDMAALHPQEHRLMLDLHRRGFRRALRGDQVFITGGGRRLHVYTHAQALADVGLRRLRDISLVAEYVNPPFHRTLLDASDAAIDSALEESKHLEPNDAKHYLFFVHRVQSYMNSANYFKQVVFDTRNVLLDDEILSLMERAPVRLRNDKQLLRRAMQRRYPEFWEIPLATEHNLEDWNWYLGHDTVVRRYIDEQLQDTESQIWRYFDRATLSEFVNSMNNYAPGSQADWKSYLRASMRWSLLKITPRMATAILAAREARYHPINRVLFRVITLKNWYDNQVASSR